MRYLWLLLPLFLTACGPSQEDINNTAIITCNIMGESRNMDAAMRIREINAAREAIGAQPYLSSDSVIKQSFRYGLCEDLVKNSPTFFDDFNSAAAEGFAICTETNLVLMEKCIDESETERTIVQCSADSFRRLATCAEEHKFDEAYAIDLSEKEIDKIRSAHGLESKEIAEQKRKERLAAREKAEPKYDGCAACHGPNGGGGIGPALAGRDQSYITQRLKAYRNNERFGEMSALMWGQAAELSDEDISDLSAYIATFK